MKVTQRALLPILAGILFGTSYIPFPPWALFFCLVPLWIVWLRANSWQQIFWTGWLAQFVFNIIGYNWIAYTVHEFAHLSWPIAILILCIFCGCANLFIPVVGLVWFALSHRLQLAVPAKIWLIPVLMGLAERAVPMLFDWNFGYPWLWARLPGFQLADIIGFQGLSTVTLFLNGLVLWTWWLWREQRRWAPAAASVVTSLAILNLLGVWHGQTAGKSDAILKFLVVQSNISDRDKISVNTVINRLASLTQQGLNVFGAADFIVWPETAFPAVIDSPTLSSAYPLQLKNFILSNHTPLITGGFSRLPSKGKYTNSLFVIGSNGEWLTEPYHKAVLLPFGEYTPMEDWFPALHRWIPEMGDLAPGPGPTVLDTGKVKLGAQICYEGLLDWFSRALANRGAQILINITNDSWFGDWEEPFQHGFQTLARAVEVRLPLVRATNTGLSTVMLAGGEMMTLSPMSQPWFHLYELPYATKPKATIFMTWGYWLFPAALMIGLPLILLVGRRKT